MTGQPFFSYGLNSFLSRAPDHEHKIRNTTHAHAHAFLRGTDMSTPIGEGGSLLISLATRESLLRELYVNIVFIDVFVYSCKLN